MARPRVIVNGYELMSSLGPSLEASLTNLLSNQSNIKRVSQLTHSNFDINDYYKDFWLSPVDYIPPKDLESKCPVFLRNRSLGMICHVLDRMQKQQTCIFGPHPVDPTRKGLAYSSLSTNQSFMFKNMKKYFTNKNLDRFTMLNTLTNANATFLTQNLQIKGPFMTNSNACAAGTSAFIDAFKAIKLDEADSVLVVSGEECDSPINLNGCYRFRVMNAGESDYVCRPFDSQRKGILLGEAAAIAVLAKYDSFQNKPKLSDDEWAFEMLGYGSTNDGFHVVQTEPHGEGAYRAMRMACSGYEADIQREGYLVVNCHAAGTQVGDQSELKALLRLARDLQVK